MKTKKLFLPLIIALAGISTTESTENSYGNGNNDGEFAYVYIDLNYLTIVTAYSDGRSEKENLKMLTPKNLERNAIQIVNLINQMKTKGYKLISTSGGDVNTHLFFVKEEN